ncbi:MAG: ArsR family transcriptional regulator [Gemmatimonadetes bacterium]|nr:ArsR family transcriptional regulator [Gemmatimonadota bacterium]MCC6774325.1 ArsR family transcriptional regulator [Gemmatimonadaceae bacterium]
MLVALKKAQPLTTKELGALFGVTPNALRRHLKELEIEGVVRYQREIRGVGGPVFAFSLTEVGERLFPRAYDSALNEVLELVRQQFGSDGVIDLFRKRWADIAEKAKPELARLPLNQRAERLAELLTTLGYMAEAPGEEGATLRENNCAIRAVIERFPEICVAEKSFLEEVLGAHVTRQSHIAAGANCCEYCIHPSDPAGTAAAEPDSLVQIGPSRLGAPALQETP